MAEKRSVGSGLSLLVMASLLAGLLVAGLVLPAVGTVGLAAKKVSDTFEDLPGDLTIPTLPQRSRILAADGTLIATVYLNEDRVVVPLSDVPEVMRKALIAVEDSRFYEHNGVDGKGLLRALVANRQNSGSALDGQGASTLTQQYVKNVLLERAGTEQERAAATAGTIERKLQEARYALELEKILTKDEILERYLNIAYFGDGVYGIGTAATHYFGIAVNDLNTQQAALLAGLVKNPTAYNPVANPNDSRARRDIVLQRMLAVGFLDQAGYEATVATPVELNVQQAGNGCSTSFAPFFCDYLLQEAQDDPAFGATADERRSRLFQGGLTITTTLDTKTQAAAQKAVDEVVRDPRVATATVSMQPGTGKVLAIAQNRPYGEGEGQTTVNYATGRGGTGFQAGSTFKIFTLLEALQQGLPTSYAIDSPNRLPTLEGCDPTGTGFTGNADVSEAGRFDLVKATEDSVNTYYVQLLKRLGVVQTARLAESLGVTGIQASIDAKDITEKSCSFTLGTQEVTPLEMAGVVAALAGHGLKCAPSTILTVTAASGETLERPEPDCLQVLEPGLADTATQVLTNVITSGTARGADIVRPAAGKTGTTQSFGAAWFVGYVPQLATAVWVGDPRGPKYSLEGVIGGTGSTQRVFGGGLPATVWKQTMLGALQDVPFEDFAPADPAVVSGRKIALPSVAGLSPEDAVAKLTQAGFLPTVSGSRVYDATTPAGLVSASSPGAGAQVTPLTPVQILLSNGQAPPRPKPSFIYIPDPAPTTAPQPQPQQPQPTQPQPQPTQPQPTQPQPTQGNGQGNGNGSNNGQGNGPG